MWTCDLCSYDSCDFEVDCVICQRCAHAQPYPEPNAESSGGDGDKSTELGSGKKYYKEICYSNQYGLPNMSLRFKTDKYSCSSNLKIIKT